MLPLHSFAKNGPYSSNSIVELSDDYDFFTGSVLLSKSEICFTDWIQIG